MRRQSVKIKKVDFLTRWDAVSCKMALLGVPSDAENRVRRRLVEFLAINSVYWKKGVPCDGDNRVRRPLVEFQVFNSINLKKSVIFKSCFCHFSKST